MSPAEDRRVLGAFAARAAVVLERRRLVGEAERARRLEEGDRIRTVLLAVVSHDLRTPLAAVKASVSSPRSDDVAWSERDEAELLAAIEEGAGPTGPADPLEGGATVWRTRGVESSTGQAGSGEPGWTDQHPMGGQAREAPGGQVDLGRRPIYQELHFLTHPVARPDQPEPRQVA